MKSTKLLFFFLILSSLLFNCSNKTSNNREIFTLNDNWRFTKTKQNNPTTLNFNDSNWKTVKVPHDWAISEPFIVDGDGSTGKLPWKAEGWYRKELDIQKSYQNKRIILIFDGVMAFPKVYINGTLVGKWDYGYNSFYLDVTDYLNFNGKNILAVHANTKQHDSRWYPGGGIFRKVQMLVVNPIHVKVWGTYITTPKVSESEADINITTTINNKLDNNASLKLEHIAYDKNGAEIARTISPVENIGKQNSKKINASFKVLNPFLWSPEQPYLYSINTNVYDNNKLVDTYKSTFGIRTINFTANDGLHLNGKRLQLKGVNLHSDFGPLGVAFNTRAMERQLEIMKSMGVNAIRNSHNVAAPEVLDLCDKMGLLFFDEIFDKYDAKADITPETNFDEFAHRNIKNFVERDRNHPSVFLWSVGNEIGDVQWNIDNGFKKLETMVNYVKQYDSTRPTTLVCDQLESAKLRHFDYYDIHSWNYGRRYRIARELEPNKSVIISESASTLSTRGFYEFPLPKKKTDFTNSLQVSSYDLNAPEWAEVADDDFMWQQDEPYVAGEFVWTGFDYLGEPTPYENSKVKRRGMTDKEASRSSYFGIVDLVGIPKDRFYLYKSYWKPEETTIHILPHWNWEGHQGQNIPVFVYTNGDSAELFINGKSQGIQYKKPKSKNSIERFRLMWNDVIYEPGEVKVIAFKNGDTLGENSVKTTGKPYKLKLTPDRTTIKANGEDLSYILVEALDEDGNTHPLANNSVNINIKGDAIIAGVGNGNPQSFEPFKSNIVNLFYGKAMIIIKSKKTKGEVVINVTSDKLKSTSTSIQLK